MKDRQVKAYQKNFFLNIVMIKRFLQCFNPFKVHAHTPEQIYTPERRPSDIFSPSSSSRKASVCEYNLFEKTLQRRLQELTDNKIL